MKHIIAILLATCLALPAFAQQKKTTPQKSTQKKTVTTKQTTTAKKTAATPQKGKTTQQKGKTTTQKGKKTTKQKGKTNKAKGNNAAKYQTKEIKGLQSQKSQVQKNIKEQQRKLQSNKADVAQRLKNLLSINGEIDANKKAIADYQADVNSINNNISLLQVQLKNLEQQLQERKQRYVKSVRYVAKHRKLQDRLMFIFSAKNLAQSYRRMRFVREYAAYQRAQGEIIKAKQAEIDQKHAQLADARRQKNNLIAKGQKAHADLVVKQNEQQSMVKSLQQQQKTIQQVIADQQKKQAELNAQIDRLVAIEVEKARKRAAEEARKKAEAEAAKKRAAEIARKKAEAEKAAREAERRIAEAKGRENAAKKRAAEAAKRKDEQAKARAQQEAREAEADRQAAERKAKADSERHKKEMAEAKKANSSVGKVSSADRQLNGTFEHNRGRLPMPITGSYKIVTRFGQYNVEGLKGVKLENRGINIQGTSGCQARAIFDGEVTGVFNAAGQWGVLVRHGSYLSVYVNLRSVSVSKGQKVSTRQVLGTVAADNILQFQLRRESTLLNPEAWLAR